MKTREQLHTKTDQDSKRISHGLDRALWKAEQETSGDHYAALPSNLSSSGRLNPQLSEAEAQARDIARRYANGCFPPGFNPGKLVG